MNQLSHFEIDEVSGGIAPVVGAVLLGGVAAAKWGFENADKIESFISGFLDGVNGRAPT